MINVIPGISIGDFHLSMSRTELLELINHLNMPFKVSTSRDGQIIRTENYSFWIENETISQISVTKNVCAKINGICGIGDTLTTCEQELKTKFIYEPYITLSADIDGIGLDIEEHPENIETADDFDKFDEGTLRVETIYIFPIQ